MITVEGVKYKVIENLGWQNGVLPGQGERIAVRQPGGWTVRLRVGRHVNGQS